MEIARFLVSLCSGLIAIINSSLAKGIMERSLWGVGNATKPMSAVPCNILINQIGPTVFDPRVD